MRNSNYCRLILCINCCVTLVAEDGITEMTAGHISVPKSFCDRDAREWFQRFEIYCSANQWNDEVKARKLPTLLEGEALAIWLELFEEQQADYEVAKEQSIKKWRQRNLSL